MVSFLLKGEMGEGAREKEDKAGREREKNNITVCPLASQKVVRKEGG